MKLSDLDTVIDRRGTGCLKYDFAVQRGKPADVLPFWVADMDFKVAEPILDALRKRIDHGIFGYSESGESYFEALKNWQKENYGWDIEPEWLIKTPGVVPAINLAVKALTKEGDGILINRPVYYPFLEAIRKNGRKLVNSPLILKNDRSGSCRAHERRGSHRSAVVPERYRRLDGGDASSLLPGAAGCPELR